MRPRRFATFAAAAVLIAACSGIGGPNVVRVSQASYPPVPVIEKLRGEPGRPYEVLAEIDWRSDDLTRVEVEDRLAETARQLGADAVLFLDRRRHENRPVPDAIVAETYRYRATAIRFRR